MFRLICLKKFICLLLLAVAISKSEAFLYRLITETLENNVAGEPITHQKTNWDFDPEIAKMRRALFYETNGYRGAKFIELIGLGIDGNEKLRRAEQQVRDRGRLNGAHYYNYPV